MDGDFLTIFTTKRRRKLGAIEKDGLSFKLEATMAWALNGDIEPNAVFF